MKNIKKFLLYGLGIFVFLIILGSILGDNQSPTIESETATDTKIEVALEDVGEVKPVSNTSSAPQATSQPAATATPAPSQNQNSYAVIKVVDGDTLDLNINGKTERIRLIGVNTPETVDPRKPVECFGVEASNKAKELLTGKTVVLEKDPSQVERDNYGRLLGYIFLPDGTNFGKKMIADGYAYEYTYSSKYKYQTEFKQAQAEAQNAKRGLWADGACQQATPTPTQSTGGNTTYTCSSNVYNCTDFKTKAEAQYVFELCGGVNNDVHKLDQDHDGEACETLP